MNLLKLPQVMRPLTAQELAQRQLASAEKDLLEAHINREAWASQCAMLEGRVRRLAVQAQQAPSPTVSLRPVAVARP